MKFFFVGGLHGNTGVQEVQKVLRSEPRITGVSRADTFILEAICDLIPFVVDDGSVYLPRRSSLQYVAFRNHVGKHFGNSRGVRDALDRLETKLFDTNIFIPRFGVFPLIHPLPNAVIYKILGDFVCELFAASREDPAADYCCEASSGNTQYLGVIRSLLPHSKCIVVIRQPLDLALSLLRVDWGPNDFESAVRYTKSYISRWEIMRSRVPPSFYLTVVYEDLLSDPVPNFARIMNFLGIDSRHDGDFEFDPCGLKSLCIRETFPSTVIDSIMERFASIRDDEEV